MGSLNTLSPATIRAFETYLGLPEDGTWDPELAAKVGAYQSLLGQTPGQTDTHDQYAALVSKLQERHAAFNTVPDPVPAQDPAFQAFMRSAGAQESEILDEIRYRTEQNSREINRRAAGFAAEKAEAEQNVGMQRETGTRNIRQDYADRGFGGASSAREQQLGQLNEQLNTGLQQRLGSIDEQQMNYNVTQRDALAEATRRLGSDAASLYRRRVDEELAARNRVAQRQLETTYSSNAGSFF